MPFDTHSAARVERALAGFELNAARLHTQVVGSGIYAIRNVINGKRYIGGTINFSKRWYAHRCLLRKGAHHSAHLQSAWNKYGEDNFAFCILSICDAESLVLAEQEMLERLTPEYNVSTQAGRPSLPPESIARRAKKMIGNKHAQGLRHTAEVKRRMSEQRRGRKRTKESVEKTAAAHRGAKRSPETCARIAAAMTGKKRKPYTEETRKRLSLAIRGTGALSEGQVRLIRKRRRCGMKRKDVAKQFGVHPTMVSMIMSGERYGWVE